MNWCDEARKLKVRTTSPFLIRPSLSIIVGTINSSVDFGTIDEIDKNGYIKRSSYPIKDIIRDSVHHYGGEPFHNIIINDLDDLGLELLEYRYDIPLYLLRKAEEEENAYIQSTFNGRMECWV